MLITAVILGCSILIGAFFIWQNARASNTNHYRKTKVNLTKPDADAELGIQYSGNQTKNAGVASKKNTNNVVVVLYLMASDAGSFGGYELLQALLSAGLRFGDKKIFHRHAHKDGRGDILFHCAAAKAPGTFDLTQIGSFVCAGLCLFYASNDVLAPLGTFDCLMETIDQLTEDLGGYVLDEKRQPFTKDTMVRIRQQLREIESSQVTADLFEHAT